MKRNLGPIMVGVAVFMVVGVVSYALLANVGATPESNDEFLEEVRAADAPSNSAIEEALLPGTTQSGELPAIAVETNHYDMGVIANEGLAEGGVTIKNNGDAPLVVSKVSTSCGCTMGYAPEKPIPPGGEAKMRVTVDPARIPGYTSTKTLTIFSNDPHNPQAQVQVSARVNPEIAMEPETIHFGVVSKGETPAQTIIARQNVDQDLEIKDVVLPPATQGVFDVELKERPESEWKNPGRKEYEITVAVKPDAPIGNQSNRLGLATNLKRLRYAYLPVNVQIKGLYDIQPPVVTLRSLQPGEEIKNVLKVTGEVPIEITDMVSENENITLSKRAGDEPNTILFDLKMVDGSLERIQRDNLILTIKAGDQTFTEEVKMLVLVEQDEAAGSTTE